MKSLITLLLLVYVPLCSFAQEVKIPETIYFAGIKLYLNHAVRKTLTTEVENLRRNPKYFQMKVDRANLYFPLIEKVFAEEGFPDDFKYLALQESSLVPDAVSSSNAVGYWQFKKASAEEVGIKVNNVVDERMNIVAASRGAAKYITKNNAALHNWVYALLSFNLGLGGVQSEVDSKYIGATSMKIHDNMHWYVIRFLAHKLAFEDAVNKNPHPDLKLMEYASCRGKSLKEIARETGLPMDELSAYNKWLLKDKVPDDKDYVVILPVRKDEEETVAKAIYGANTQNQEEGNKEATEKQPAVVLVEKHRKRKTKKKKELVQMAVKQGIALITSDNKLKAIKARAGDTFEKLAAAADISLDNFFLYNEIGKYQKPIAGAYYYIQPKRNKAILPMHVVQEGETLWQIGQQYGVRSNAIRKKNRLKLGEEPLPGRVLFLRRRLKRDEKPTYKEVTTPPVKKENVKKMPVAVRKEVPVQTTLPDAVVSKPAISPVVQTAEAAIPIPDTAQIQNTDAGVKAPTVNVKTPEDASRDSYLVEPGETLYSLSKKFNTPIDSLIKWNNLQETSLKAGINIWIQQETKVPVNTETIEASVILHTVQQGETLYRISRLYGKSIEDILKWNDKKDYSVHIGEQLKIFQ